MADATFQRVSSAGSTNTQSEKPFHYTYLKEFRVDQCKLFLQHKCTQHRPYTCFYWHFMNQRRRRPVRKRDGTFNYSPDIYCSSYDENTGICPNGDDCPYLHRNAGDTERRYHLRYYKTSTCVYETDARGFCVKNGPHCAFAHGPHDLRTPVYDIRELTGEVEEDRLISPLVGSLEREKGVLVDDPRWNDSSFVLTYYKTDPCKRPPRLCRQGYACPFYHNNKDRRRSPKTFKYRSTPCPDVKINDEWSDPINCDQKDHCCYCHTRTEQQFHPEIYKSTRCNDVQSTGYCPRGPFCAFAHDDKELTSPRELTEEPMTPETASSISLEPLDSTLTQTIGSRPSSAATPTMSDMPSSFQRAPGAEVRSKSLGEEDSQAYLKKQLLAIESDMNLDESEKQRRKQSLLRLSFVASVPTSNSGLSPDNNITSTNVFQSSSLPSSNSDALEVTIGHSIEDLSLDDFDPTTQIDTTSIEIGGSSTTTGTMLGQSPVAQGFLQSLQSPFSASLGFGPLSPFPAPQHIQTNLGLTTPTSPLATGASMSPISHSGRNVTMAQIVQSPSKAPGSPSRPTPLLQSEKPEIIVLREELKQTRSTCNAWKVEAEGANTQALLIGKERDDLIRKMEKLEEHVKQLESKVTSVQSLTTLSDDTKLSQLSLSHLYVLRNQMRDDLEKLNTVISTKLAVVCLSCKEAPRTVLFQPCQHIVLCQTCSNKVTEPVVCLYCNARINQKISVTIPHEL